ncbi:MAG TPA: protoporphyrinogen oxidase [Alphaproteobacteria bacterium]|nr:protoporphyrinogen oxidase [Alphaproteobacteria bacterium]
MKRVAIIGGGIAGLSAAYYLEKAKRGGAQLEWKLLEKSGRFGGVIRTEHDEGYVLEAGPDSFLTVKPDATRLCRDLGIADQLISSNDFQRKTYILVKGRLLPIPDGLEFMVPTRLWPMAATGLFSLGTKLRMAREMFTSAPTGDHSSDESVAEFVRRHFGSQMVDRVAEPLLAGVYGGNADRMSVRAVLPRFAEMERQHGSLVRASLQARKARMKAAVSPQPLFTSLKSGVQQMTDALVAALPPASLFLNQKSIDLKRSSHGWHLASAGVTGEFDAVFLAVPAPVAAGFLRPIHSELASTLARIQYTSSAAVALAYDQAALPPGFGFLVPRSEGRKILACTFVHKKFSHRAPEGAALLRCFFSSSRVSDLASLSDEDLQQTARKELQEILRLNAEPRFVRTFRWTHALPQYEVGHLERVAELEKQLEGLPGLHIIGNSFYGIGIPDCIKSGRLAAEKVIAA